MKTPRLRVNSSLVAAALVVGLFGVPTMGFPDFAVVPSGQTDAGAGEIRAAESYAIVNNQVTLLNNQHVFEIVFTGMTHEEEEHPQYQGHYNTIDRWLCVPNSPEIRFGKVGTVVPGIVQQRPTSAGDPEPMMAYGPFLDGKVPVHVPALGGYELLGREFFVIQVTQQVQWVSNGQGGWVQETTKSYLRWDLNLDKLMCSEMGVSIDTRKAYGQPNTDGQLFADANAELREINFSNWIYRGGLFAGRMPDTHRDRSGTARMQFVTTDTETEGDFVMAVLALLYIGRPDDADGSVSLGAYVPSFQDANLEVEESALTWANRWTSIAPETYVSGDHNWSIHPTRVLTFASGTPTSQYSNWGLTPSTGTPPWTHKAVCIAVDNETGLSSGFTAWRYFASRWFVEELPQEVTERDFAPRIWCLRKTGTSTWN